MPLGPLQSGSTTASIIGESLDPRLFGREAVKETWPVAGAVKPSSESP